MKPRLLDLFCCAGGASKGYADAGFEVVGVDIAPQPNYPFEFMQGDALELLPLLLARYQVAAIGASPPCPDHSSLRFGRGGAKAMHGTGWLLQATIDRLATTGLPYVVENVARAVMPGSFILCGRSFGTPRLKRHRRFLTNFLVDPPACACKQFRHVQTIGIYGDLRKNDRKITNGVDGYVRMRAGVDTARRLLGCPWMDAKELTQAIPPAYTRWIGTQLMAHLNDTARAAA